MNNEQEPRRNAFDAFYADKTPANAVALAYADHQGHNGGRGVWDFLDALRKAEAQCRAHDDVVTALSRALNWLSSYPGGGALDVYNQARAALAKAGAA
jgi:hypothetical protein